MSGRSALRWQVILWTAYAAIRFFALLPAVESGDRGMLVLMQAVRAVTGLIASSAVGWVLLRQTAREPSIRWTPLILVAIIAAFAWMFIDRALLVAIAPIVGGEIPWQSVPRGFEMEYGFVLLGWTAGAVTLIQARRQRELEQALLQRELDAQAASLQALTAQLNPHFLFNALNMIRSLVVDDPNLARGMLTRLATLLRRVLEINPTSLIELHEEFSLLNDYLHIQEARFEGGLSVHMDLPDDLRGLRVPPLILQPLVENAIKFGGADSDGVRRVRIRATRDAADVQIEVHNSGSMNTHSGGHGIGLALTRRRLDAVYPGSRLQLEETGQGVIARIRVDCAERELHD